MINSICIVRLSALGDVLMMVPLIRTLQKHFPKAKLTWIISKPAYFLVEGMDGIEFIVIDRPKSLADYWRFRRQMKHRHFDVLLAPQACMKANLLYPLIPAQRKIGYDKLRAKDKHLWFIKESITPGQDHTLESFLKFAKPLGIDEQVLRWDLPIGEEEHDWVRSHLPSDAPLLVVNPAASKLERSWMIDRYITVLQQAIKRWGVHVVLTGGPAPFEKKMADEIAAVVPATNLVGKTKPKQLLAVIKQASAVLCPDTGPSHMATAVNTPVVALHAVTNPLVSGPYLFPHLVVNCYPKALESILKTPYEDHVWGTHVHSDKAMQLIPVEAVLEKLATIFEPNT